jgi:hypothetical protein
VVTFYYEIELNNIMNSYNTKRSQLEKQKDSLQLLVLGNSQVLRGINPEFFHNVIGYNLANVGQSIFYDCRITLKYLDKLPKLKYVLIGVSYVAMGYQIHTAAESWRDYYYEQFWGIAYPGLDWFDLRRYSKIVLYGPDSSISYSLKKFNVNLAQGYRNNGWAYIDTITIDHTFDEKTLKKIANSINLTYLRANVLKSNCDDLKWLIIALKMKHITPVVLTLPVYTIFSKYAAEKNTFFTLLSNICKEQNCLFYNYFDDSRFHRADYYDYLHLNFVGAEKFSKIIDEEVLKKIHSND